MLTELLVVEDGECYDYKAQDTEDCQRAIDCPLNIERLSIGRKLRKNVRSAKVRHVFPGVVFVHLVLFFEEVVVTAHHAHDELFSPASRI